MGTVPVLKPREVSTTVPFHKGRDISPTLLRQIAKDIRISTDDLISPASRAKGDEASSKKGPPT